jgi:surfeit locus 1 family protein
VSVTQESSGVRTLLVVLATVVGLIVTGTAGVWQFQRGVEKDRIGAAAERASAASPVTIGARRVVEHDLRFRRIRAVGQFVPGSTILLDNQMHGSRPGYVVFTALRLNEGGHVVVKRGWIEGSPDRRKLPDVKTPEGAVEILGVALPPNRRALELSSDVLSKPVWQNVTVERYTARFGLEYQPIILEQHGEAPDDLVRDWPQPAVGSAKNYGYAFQWGAMFILILGLHVYFYIRRRNQARAS